MIHTGDALVLGMRCEWSASLGSIHFGERVTLWLRDVF